MIKRGNLSAQTTQNQLQTQYKELKFVEEAVSLEPTGQIDVLCNTKKNHRQNTKQKIKLKNATGEITEKNTNK